MPPYADNMPPYAPHFKAREAEKHAALEERTAALKRLQEVYFNTVTLSLTIVVNLIHLTLVLTLIPIGGLSCL